MGARTRRLIFVRLMAVCAICFMAIGHLLYSMTAGLDGYARLHMSVIAPSATSHKDLDVLMRKNADQRGVGKTAMKQGCLANGKTKLPVHCKNASTRVKGTSRNSRLNAGKSEFGKQPFIHEKSWHIKDITYNGLDSYTDTRNMSLVHVKHCPHLQLDFSKLIEVIKAKGSSPWQPVSPGNRSYVHSAYYDGRVRGRRSGGNQGGVEEEEKERVKGGGVKEPKRGTVVIIGIVGNLKVTELPRYCQLWYPEQDNEEGGEEVEDGDSNGIITIRRSPMVVPIKALKLADGNAVRSAAFLYTCELPTRRQPLGVSLVEEPCSSPTNYLTTIRQSPPREKAQFTVCVPALRPDFQDADALLQMVEINRMFGGDRFTLYIHSAGSDVTKHVRKYVADNIASKVAYTFPLETSSSRRQGKISNDLYKALRMASINDCLYRNMFKTKYIIFASVDEMLVPRGFKKWWDMLKEVADDIQKSAVSASSFSHFPIAFKVKSVLFRTEWPDNPMYAKNPQVQKLHLYSLLKTNREQIGLPGRDKAGFIVNPAGLTAVGSGKLWGIHNEAIQGISVPESMGLVHRYRLGKGNQQMGGIEGGRTGTQRMIGDHTLLAYYDVILSRVLERHERVNSVIS